MPLRHGASRRQQTPPEQLGLQRPELVEAVRVDPDGDGRAVGIGSLEPFQEFRTCLQGLLRRLSEILLDVMLRLHFACFNNCIVALKWASSLA